MVPGRVFHVPTPTLMVGKEQLRSHPGQGVSTSVPSSQPATR